MDKIAKKLLLLAEEFSTKEELKKYLKKHPEADKSKHSVKKKKKSPKSLKSFADYISSGTVLKGKVRNMKNVSDMKAIEKLETKNLKGLLKDFSKEEVETVKKEIEKLENVAIKNHLKAKNDSDKKETLVELQTLGITKSALENIAKSKK